MAAFIDLEDFEKWLRAKPEERVVGRARDPVDDPLANFLLECLHRAALVGRERMKVGQSVVELPQWARVFERSVDRRPRFSPITAAVALRLLTAARRPAHAIRRG